MIYEDILKLKPGDKVIVYKHEEYQAADIGSIAIFNKIAIDSIFSKSKPGIDVTWIRQVNKDGIEVKIGQSDGGYWARSFDLYEKIDNIFIV